MSEFYEDKTLNCRDCRQPFTFTGGEQRFYAERQFTEPNRCKPCRAAKKAAREAQNGGSPPVQSYGAPPPAQLDSASPRRPFVYEPAQDAQRGFNAGAPGAAPKKRSGGGKRRRDEESGWGGGGYDD